MNEKSIRWRAYGTMPLIGCGSELNEQQQQEQEQKLHKNEFMKQLVVR